LKIFIETINITHPTTECPNDHTDEDICVSSDKRYFAKFPLDWNAHGLVHSWFWVYQSPVCEYPDLPVPYIENVAIKVCLTASASAQKVASKSLKDQLQNVISTQAQTGTAPSTCTNILLHSNGTPTIKHVDCMSMQDSTDLINCFFEINTSFKFSIRYGCFYPQLWATWFRSFRRIFLEMLTKGYAVITPYLQSRYCYLNKQQLCMMKSEHETHGEVSVGNPCNGDGNVANRCNVGLVCVSYQLTSSTTPADYNCVSHLTLENYQSQEDHTTVISEDGTMANVMDCRKYSNPFKCIIPYEHFCNTYMMPNQPNDYNADGISPDVSTLIENHEMITQAEIDENYPLLTSYNNDQTPIEYYFNREKKTNEQHWNFNCKNRNNSPDGFSKVYAGSHCPASINETRAGSGIYVLDLSEDYIKCVLNYPLFRIHQILKSKSDDEQSHFPKVDFGKKLPSD